MGFGDAVATFVGKAKDTFSLNNFEAQLIAFAGLIMFGVLSVPMGIVQNSIGKKNTLLIGLSLALLGVLVVLGLGVSNFAVFLVSVFSLGAGAAILQVAGNPIMRDVSAEGKYSSNLSLGQFIKAIGSNTAPVVFFCMALFCGNGAKGLSADFEWNVVFAIFAAGIAVTIVGVAALKIKESGSEGSCTVVSCIGQLGNPYVASMVLGIFLYVGAEVCVSSGMPIFFTENFGVSSDMATQYVTYFFLAIMAGRLLGAAVLRVVNPSKFLTASALTALLGFALLLLGGRAVSTIALFVIAFGYANIFPLIFSISIDKMPGKSNELSGLMVTAIVGGAILPPIMGLVADALGSLAGFIVPAAAVVYVLALSLTAARAK